MNAKLPKTLSYPKFTCKKLFSRSENLEEANYYFKKCQVFVQSQHPGILIFLQLEQI